MPLVEKIAAMFALLLTLACEQSTPAQHDPHPGVFSDRTQLTEMVRVPGGTLLMESQGASHAIAVDAFEIDVTEVTVRSYCSCVEAGACEPRATVDWTDLPETKKQLYSLPCNWGKPDRDSHPMNCVDWHDAARFCAWAGKRLPTEHEWEMAAHGSTGSKFPWGDDEPRAKLVNGCGQESVRWAKVSWKKDWVPLFDEDDGWPTTSPVGSYPKGASPFGLVDMAGNVWEWTSSYYEPDAPDREAYRVHRGGGWNNENPDHHCSAFRNRLDPSFRNCNLGFRCAR